MNGAPPLMKVCAAPIMALVTCCSSPSVDPAAEHCQSVLPFESAQPGPCGGADLGKPAVRFRSCRTDDDCIAVPVVGCCHNGWKTSVSREEEDDYERSFRCPSERPICPMYLVKDTRVPECNPATSLCELVPVGDIGCGPYPYLPGHCFPASSQ
jgi:hypothetical protein